MSYNHREPLPHGAAACARRQRGLTLVEMLLALLILSVLMTIGAPGMRDFLRENRLQAQSLDLFRSLQYARSEAVKLRSRVLLCRSADPVAATPACGGTSTGDWSQGWLVFASGDADSDYDVGTDRLLRVGQGLGSSLTLNANSEAETVLVYDADGTVTAGSTVRFALCDERGGAHGRQINLTVTGRPAIEKGGGGVTVNCTSPS